MKIIIIGVGALGSHLVLGLRNVKADLKVIDFDRVEAKNVTSQFHWKVMTSKKKVTALGQAMAYAFGRTIEAVPHRLTAENVNELLGGGDLLVDCLDNGESRRLVQGYARQHRVPCLHGALAADGTFGQVAWTEAFRIDDEAGAGAPTCEDGEFLPFIQLVAAHLAGEVQRFLAGERRESLYITPKNLARI